VPNKFLRIHNAFGPPALQHFKPDVLPFGLFCFLFSFQHALFGRADFVDHDLPLRSAVARAVYRTA
jgi:hypothetical protein